jgi:hypothetical protein
MTLMLPTMVTWSHIQSLQKRNSEEKNANNGNFCTCNLWDIVGVKENISRTQVIVDYPLSLNVGHPGSNTAKKIQVLLPR